MRLDRIVLENFGVYARQKFQFDNAPLVVVYGPNESGKTTALNGLRSAMFGFPVRTPYLTGKAMSAEVVGRLADGTQFQFTRKKARKDEVAGKLGTRRIAGDDLTTIFGEMDLDSYQQLFGFSLDELRDGEAALKNAKLSEALAGGGMGGANVLQQLRTELSNSVTSLYRSRGASRIGNVLNDIRSRQDELKSLQTLPIEVETLRGQLQAAAQTGDEAKAKYAELHQLLTRAERAQQAYPKLQELRRTEQTLASIDVPDGIDATFIGQWSDYAQQQKNLQQAIQEEQLRLQHEQQAIAKLSGSNFSAVNETRVELLGHQASEIPKLRERLVELQRQLSDATSGQSRALEALGLDAVSESLLELTISAPQRTEIHGWSSNVDRITKELLSVTARLESVTDQLAQLEDIEEYSETPENLAMLVELVKKISEEDRAQEHLVESVCEKCESPEFEVLGARLRARLEDCPALDYSWPIPSPDAIARHLRSNEEMQRNIAQVQREIHRLTVDLARAERELAEYENSGEQSTWSELKNISHQRDQVIDGWLDELMEPLLAHSISPDQQKLRLQQLKLLHERSDGLLQQLVETAETLAKIGHAKKHVRAQQTELASAREQLERELTRQKQLDQQWLEAWRLCPFEPLAPELMSSWVTDFAAWSTVAAELDIERRKLVTSRAALKQLRSELVDQWPAIIEFETPVTALRDHIQQWEQHARQSQSQSSRRIAIETQHTELQQQQANLTQRKQSITSEFAKWLANSSLPVTWPLDQATVLLENIERLKRDHRIANQSGEQIAEIQQRITAFEAGVAELVDAMESAKVGLPPEILAGRWLTALQNARKDTADRAKLSASIEHRGARIGEMQERLKDIQQRLAALAASVEAPSGSGAGNADRLALDSLMQRAQQAADLRIARSELLSTLEMLAGKESLEQFLSTLTDTDDGQIAVQIAEVKRELANCEIQRQQADQEVGALSSRLDQLAKSEAAQRAQHQLHAQRGELAELAEQWVVGRLAQELLSRCIDRFTTEHEPALLQLTHQFLAKLTGGRYISVEHDGSSAGSFVVRNSRGEAIEPNKLSTGTREQLHLAIRMAFITHYTEHHEPLPVLMDDCFVNFDDARTRLALQTLLNWNGAVQTILLSCHGRVVQQIAELAPDTPVICLDRHSTHAARELIGELAISAS